MSLGLPEKPRDIMKEEPEGRNRSVDPSQMGQHGHPPALLDWRPDDWDWDRGLSIGFLVHGSDLFEEPGVGSNDADEIARELQELTAAERVHCGDIDPTVGAGSNGLGFLLQLAGVAADIATLALVAPIIKRKIIAAMAHLRRRLAGERYPVSVSLTAEALQVLVMAEACSRNEIDPHAVVRMDISSHEIDPPDPVVELKQLYAAHTVTLEAVRDDGYHHVWVYTVSPTGRVLADSHVQVPIPNSTRWGWPMPERARFLDGLQRADSESGAE